MSDSHTVGEGDAIGNLANSPIGSEQSDHAGSKLATGKVKTLVVDVSVASTVYDDLVPGVPLLGEAAQVGMGHK
jgi:hypothetical protein